MRKIVTKVMAVALALTTMVSMSGVMTVNAEAAAKSNVSVSYTNKKVKSASVKSVSVKVDGAEKASKKVTVYLTGNKQVKVDTAVDVKVNGKKNSKMTKAFKKNYKKVSYSSSNKKVATVSSKGVITAKKAGKTTITVKSKANSKKSYKITLTVKNGVKSMKLNTKTKATLEEGAKLTFTPKVTTYKKVKKTIKATSSDKKVAKVSVKSGKVTITAVKAGTAKITVAPKYGSDKAKTITVTVKAKAATTPSTPSTPVVKAKHTKVVFANPDAKTVKLTGKLSWDGQKDLAAAVKDFAAILGGTYDVKVNGRVVTVINGILNEDQLAKIPTSGEKTDATIEATISIAQALKLAGDVSATAKAQFNGEFTVGGVKVSGISLANKELTFNFGGATLKAYVVNGNLYLDGDQSALLTTYKAIYDTNKEVIKEFVVEEK